MKIIKTEISSDLSTESLKAALYQLNKEGENVMCGILMLPMGELFHANVVLGELKREAVTEPHHLWVKCLDITINHSWPTQCSHWALIGGEIILENDAPSA